MKTVKIHKVDTSNFDWIYDSYKDRAIKLFAESKKTYGILDLINKDLLDYFFEATALNKKEDYTFFLSSALFGLSNYLKIKANKGAETLVNIDGEDIIHKADEGDFEIADALWIEAYELSLILRDYKSISDLVKVTKEDISYSKNNNYIYYTFFEIVYNYNTDKSAAIDLSELNLYAQKIFGKDIQEPSIKAFQDPFTYMLYLKALIFNDVVQNDNEQFNKHLLDAVKYHKAFWSQKRGLNRGETHLCEIPEGFISLPLTALCSMAFDKGMKIEVESDYIPKYLYDGSFLKGQ